VLGRLVVLLLLVLPIVGVVLTVDQRSALAFQLPVSPVVLAPAVETTAEVVAGVTIAPEAALIAGVGAAALGGYLLWTHSGTWLSPFRWDVGASSPAQMGPPT